MKRTDDTFREQDKFGTGLDGYTEGDPGVTARTQIRADMMDHLQEEIANAISPATPDGNSYKQLLGALQFADLQRAFSLATPFTTPGTPSIYDVCGGISPTETASEALAVGASGTLYRMVSEQFAADTPASSYAGTFQACCAAGATYGHVAVGTAEEIQTGTGGTWTRRNTGANDLNGVAFNPTDDEVVAVGDSDTIWHGTALATWTARTSALATGNLNGVVWAASLGLWICWGTTGIQTSPDGITWTQRSTLNIDCLCWIDSLGQGIAIENGSPWNIHTSTDALTWTDSTVDNGFAASAVVGCAGGVFVRGIGTVFPKGWRFTSGVFDANSTAVSFGLNDNIGSGDLLRYDPVHQGWWCWDYAAAAVLSFLPAPHGV